MTQSSAPRADVAVIGGTGFYSFLDDPREVEVETPYGAPSAPVSLGTVAGRSVAFVPRHGPHHEHPPHRINHRANLWALRSLGVRQVLAPCAVGGLRDEVVPGDVVVPDQLVDRTSGRVQTYVETGAIHLPFADPYCDGLRASVLAAGAATGGGAERGIRDGGTMVVVEGPRFSTRAESRWFADQGWTLVNMTGHPEAVLAREMRQCYAAIALVTDMDAGATSGEGVGQEEVFARFRDNLDRLRALLTATVERLPDPDGCTCSTWADGIDLTYDVPGTA
ncbi:S-methyl-5'-thioadenosine phosphorylase [Nocardioides zeae]